MASISPGTDGTFKATTAEGRALEVLTFTQLQEQAAASNPSNRNAVIASIDLDDRELSGTFAIPAEQSFAYDGALLITATPYLENVFISVGMDEPTFKSTTLERYLLEVLMYLQWLEGQAEKNPQNANRITGSFNSDTRLYSGTFRLPLGVAIASDGKLTIQATEYLTT
jgi:hypothetical protein